MTCKQEKQPFSQLSMSTKHKEASFCQHCILCSPWKIWITCLVSKVLSITLLSTLIAVSVSTVCMFTLCGNRRWQGWRGHVIQYNECAQQSTRSYYRPPNADARLTDAAVSDDSVSVITLLPVGNLHYPITTVTFIVRCIFHGLERRQLEWKSLLQSLKKLEQKKKKKMLLKCIKIRWNNRTTWIGSQPSMSLK